MLYFALSSFLDRSERTLNGMESLAERIAVAVQTARDKNGMTVEQVAERLGVSKQSVYQWVTVGERKDLNGTNLVDLSELSGISPMWIMRNRGPQKMTDNADMLLTEFEKSLIHNLRQLPQPAQEALAAECFRQAAFWLQMSEAVPPPEKPEPTTQ